MSVFFSHDNEEKIHLSYTCVYLKWPAVSSFHITPCVIIGNGQDHAMFSIMIFSLAGVIQFYNLWNILHFYRYGK